MSLNSASSATFYVGKTTDSSSALKPSISSASFRNLDSSPKPSATFLNSKDDLFMHEFLEVSRNSDLEQLKSLIKLGKSGKNLNSEDIKFDINYRGKSKRFYGWTALHITCYFNHLEAVKLLLQQPECDINVANYENDTPLHKACLTSRYEIVELLLMNNADINLKNNEGLKPKDLATDQAVKKLMQATEKSENHNLQKQFFEAVISNNLDLINKLVKSKNFDINCVDTFGNSALHLVSNRNQCEIATLLMQHGINTVTKNQNNLTALDLAKTKEMKEILGYMPYNWRKYEGVLMKKRKFLGFKEYYVVLNKGSIIYYQNKNDASKDFNRKGTYFLNNAFIGDYPTNGNTDNPEYSWTINYTNGRKHTLCSALGVKKRQRTRSTRTAGERKKKWISAINEHIRFSESQVESQQNENKNLLPMESIQQSLNVELDKNIVKMTGDI